MSDPEPLKLPYALHGSRNALGRKDDGRSSDAIRCGSWVGGQRPKEMSHKASE